MVLVAVLVALVVGFGARFNGTDAYPDAAAIDANYADRVGDRLHLWTIVVGERDGRVVVTAAGLRLRVSDPPPSAVEPGDRLQIYGEFRPNHRFETTRYVVARGENRAFMLAVSALGGLLAAGAFLRRWRVDRHRLAFVPRGADRNAPTRAEEASNASASYEGVDEP